MTTIEVRVLAHIKVFLGKKTFPYTFEGDLTVWALLTRLDQEYKLGPFIFKADHTLRDDVRILLGGRDIQFLSPEKLVLQPGDIVLIMPTLAGG